MYNVLTPAMWAAAAAAVALIIGSVVVLGLRSRQTKVDVENAEYGFLEG
jgi:hypothetical protein